jgi:hypothetical protein
MITGPTQQVILDGSRRSLHMRWSVFSPSGISSTARAVSSGADVVKLPRHTITQVGPRRFHVSGGIASAVTT